MIVYCSECEYFVRHNLPEWGQCRRKAPSPERLTVGSGFVGPYNHRALWPYVRVNDFCGEGVVGKNEIKIPEISENQEIKLDTLPDIGKFEMSIQKARLNNTEKPNLLEKLNKENG